MSTPGPAVPAVRQSSVQLIIHVRENLIRLGTAQVRGRHRWEAAVLASLLSACRGTQTGWRSGEELSTELMALGQARPLQRRQWGRLMDGLRDCFASLGPHALEGFDARFGHAPRQRTVGPWRWQPKADDTWEVAAHVETPAGAAVQRISRDWPRLADGPAAQAQSICQDLLVAEALIAEGLPQEGLAVLGEPRDWAAATGEVQALRAVLAADAAVGLRRFDEADDWLESAEDQCQDHPWASRLLAGRIQTLRLRRQVSAGLRRDLARCERPSACAQHTPLARHEVDLWLILAQEALRQPGDLPRFEQALGQAEAALLGAVALRDPVTMRSACTVLSRLCTRGRADWHDPLLDQALQWHCLAEAVNHRFDLALSSAWEFLHIGQLWLDWPAELRLRIPLQQFMWNHLTPDALSFHQVALDLAQQVGDPLQVACAAINLHRRADSVRQQDEAARALRLLLATMKAHPDLRAVMVAEGWEFPTPLRRQRARAKATA